MGGFMRASLATITVVGIAGVVLRLSGLWDRFEAAWQRLTAEDPQRRLFEGRLGRVYARYYAPLATWLYAAYAKGLDLQPEDEVLDVACGSGVFLARHARHVRRIAGLDRSQAMIDQARRENAQRVADGSAEFVVGDVTALPWEDDTFTVVTSNDVNCYEAKAPAAVKEMYRVLKPGGRAVIGTDRCELMEAAGFQRVSGRHVLGAYLTTGYKD
jgi:SAM-dependent methyltransferase